jgi:hypothetical protein
MIDGILLIEKEHISFESWFIKLLRQGLLPEAEPVRIIDYRTEYMRICWREEELWQKWSESNAPKEN